MIVNFSMFIILSILLIPVAYVVGIIDKAKHNKYHTKDDQMMNYCFYIFGFLFLLFDIFADVYYFWLNNFKTGLKKIIIEVEDSTISHISLREIEGICKKYSKAKIKAMHTKVILKHFRSRFNVIQNI